MGASNGVAADEAQPTLNGTPKRTIRPVRTGVNRQFDYWNGSLRCALFPVIKLSVAAGAKQLAGEILITGDR
jgi:hypothetical protein